VDDTAEGAVDGVTVTDPATMRRAVAAAAVGNITEWFDFGVYGYLATTIEAEFFPPGPLSQVAVFATFAIAFFFRPLGGLFFGPLGDRIGRTKVLSITVILMALGTFLIGLIPSYASIGLAAPILLVAARVLQGFSTGGEYAGAMTFIAEYAPDRRRGYFGSFLELGTFVGYALGATIASVLPLVLSAESMSSWGWRIPFFVALPLGIVGVYLRVKLEETPAFQTLLSESEEREGTQVKDGLKLIFTKYLPTFVMVGGVVVAWNVTNYMLTSYMPTYLETTVDQHGGTSIDSTTSSWLQIAVLWLAVGAAACVNATHAAVYAFSSLHWRSIGFSGEAVGWLWAVAVLAEIAVFLFAGSIAARGLVGLRWIAIAAVAAALRFGAMSADPDLAVTFLLQLLHGVTFGCMHLGTLAAVSALSPEARRAAAQGRLVAASALVMGLTTILSGYLYRLFGPGVFLAMVPVALLGLVLAVLAILRARGDTGYGGRIGYGE